MIAADEQTLRTVVREVLARLGEIPSEPHRTNGSAANGHAAPRGGDGVFASVDDAVAAANDGFRQLARHGLESRAKIVAAVKTLCEDHSEAWGKAELAETKIGRLDHKVEKLTAIRRVPGTEYLRTGAATGDRGMTVLEYAPFGVVGAITPVTHSLPTLASNVVSMVAAGNAVVFNPHPSGKNIACEGVRAFNRAIRRETGITNLVTIVGEPTIESAQAIFEHRDVPLLVVTGGPAVARAALACSKRAIVAGPGNPPVLVDETADLDIAAEAIVAGAAYDNNLLCIGEKEVFCVESAFDGLMKALARHGGYRLDGEQVRRLTAAAFTPAEEPPVDDANRPKAGQYAGKSKPKSNRPKLNRDLIGKDPAVLAEAAGVRLPDGVQLLFGEADGSNPFVPEEQMMPFVPVVRCRDWRHGLDLCVEHEHGFRHTAIVHSNDLRRVTEFGRRMNTTLVIANGPSTAALGGGGEGVLSYSIATPTGEGVTTPLTFCRMRRASVVDALRLC